MYGKKNKLKMNLSLEKKERAEKLYNLSVKTRVDKFMKEFENIKNIPSREISIEKFKNLLSFLKNIYESFKNDPTLMIHLDYRIINVISERVIHFQNEEDNFYEKDKKLNKLFKKIINISNKIDKLLKPYL